MLPFTYVAIGVIGILSILSVTLLFLYIKSNNLYKSLKADVSKRAEEVRGKVYETKLLDDIHSRYGYSINTTKILDVVLASLDELLKFSSVSYLMLEGNKMVFRTHLSENVSKDYIEEIKDSMIDKLRQANPRLVSSNHLEESVSGSLTDSENDINPLSSIDVTLTENDEVIGLLNVSSIKKDAFSKEDETVLARILTRIMNEITKLEELIGHEKTKLEVMIENMNDGIVMIDNDFRVLVINPACNELLGLEYTSSVSIFDIVGFFSKAFPLDQLIAEVFDSGESKSALNIEIGEKYFDIVVIPVNGRVNIKGVGILIHDKSKEVELNKLREEFTSMIVHELRSPLTVMLDTADLMINQQKNLSEKQVVTLMQQMKNSAQGLLSIVSDLLDMAKLEAGKMKITKKANDLNKLLLERVNYFKHLAANKGVNLLVDTDTSLKDLEFDNLKIEQVLNNLISNAIKFTDDGEIRVTSESKGTFVEVTVADTGVGITPEGKEKLFNKFEQVHESMSSKQKGTGLGLAISKGIVEAHGGEISIEDNKPKGTKFVFTIPVAE